MWFGQSVRGSPPTQRRSAVFWLVNALLFDCPRRSLGQLERMFVDEMLTLPHWTGFITSEVTRWTNISTQVCESRRCAVGSTNIIAKCVILGAANIAFLAIPTVLPSDNDGNGQSHDNIRIWVQLFSLWSSAILLMAVATTVIAKNYYSGLYGTNSDNGQVVRSSNALRAVHIMTIPADRILAQTEDATVALHERIRTSCGMA